MLGFIKKDLLMMRSNLKFLVILWFVYGFMAFQGKMDLSFLLPFMTVMIMMSTFSYDAFNKWDAYAITLPDGRKNSVRAKYLSTILLILATTILVAILELVIAYARKEVMDFENILLTMFGGVFATTFLQSVMYPSIYKFGIEKARIGIFVVVFGTVIIGGLLFKYIDLTALEGMFRFLEDYGEIIFPIFMVLMLYVSYKISEGIFEKKEF